MSAAALAACYLLSKLKVLKEKEFPRLFHGDLLLHFISFLFPFLFFI